MDSNINNSMRTSATNTDVHFFPTSFDPFLDSSSSPASFPTSTWAPPDPVSANPVTSAPSGGPTSRPKKRSRASRRAPTTVLTTDTSNFRAMVQEFTGIPSPPFPTSSTSAATFPRFRHFLHTSPSLPPPPSPLNFQALLHSQLVSLHHPPNLPSSSSGELRLPGVIGSGAGDASDNPMPNTKLTFPAADRFNADKGTTDQTMDSWICSSD